MSRAVHGLTARAGGKSFGSGARRPDARPDLERAAATACRRSPGPWPLWAWSCATNAWRTRWTPAGHQSERTGDGLTRLVDQWHGVQVPGSWAWP